MFRAAVSTEVLPVLGVVGVFGGLFLGVAWWAGAPDDVEPVTGPLASGVVTEEDTTYEACARVAGVHGRAVPEDAELTVSAGVYVWEFGAGAESFTCRVSASGDLYLSGVAE